MFFKGGETMGKVIHFEKQQDRLDFLRGKHTEIKPIEVKPVEDKAEKPKKKTTKKKKKENE